MRLIPTLHRSPGHMSEDTPSWSGFLCITVAYLLPLSSPLCPPYPLFSLLSQCQALLSTYTANVYIYDQCTQWSMYIQLTWCTPVYYPPTPPHSFLLHTSFPFSFPPLSSPFLHPSILGSSLPLSFFCLFFLDFDHFLYVTSPLWKLLSMIFLLS